MADRPKIKGFKYVEGYGYKTEESSSPAPSSSSSYSSAPQPKSLLPSDLKSYSQQVSGTPIASTAQKAATVRQVRRTSAVGGNYVDTSGRVYQVDYTATPSQPQVTPPAQLKPSINLNPGKWFDIASSKVSSYLEPKMKARYEARGAVPPASLFEPKYSFSVGESIVKPVVFGRFLTTSTTGIQEVKPRLVLENKAIDVRSTGQTEMITSSKRVGGMRISKTVPAEGFEGVGRVKAYWDNPFDASRPLKVQEFSVGLKGQLTPTGMKTITRPSGGALISRDVESFAFRGTSTSDLITSKGLGASSRLTSKGMGYELGESTFTATVSGSGKSRAVSLLATKELSPGIYASRGIGAMKSQASPFKIQGLTRTEGALPMISQDLGAGASVSRVSTVTLQQSLLTRQVQASAQSLAAPKLSQIGNSMAINVQRSGIIGSKMAFATGGGLLSGIAKTRQVQASASSLGLKMSSRLISPQALKLSTGLRQPQAFAQALNLNLGQPQGQPQRQRGGQSLALIQPTMQIQPQGQQIRTVSPGGFALPFTMRGFGGDLFKGGGAVLPKYEGGLDSMGGFTGGGKKFTKYTPSFGAIIFNVKGRKVFDRIGIRLRPILSAFRRRKRRK